LIIGGAFISFVVLNAKTVEDVKFFYSLGINLNDINNFILRAVTVIFSVLIFIETLFLIIYLFKFALTKKEFKQKKIRNGILAAIILILASGSGSAWLMIDKKIRALPNWQEMAYGDVQLYDNTKLISEGFDKGLSLLSDTTNLIGPMQIKFDLNFFAQSEERKGLTIKKYIWDFGNGEIKESPIPTMIYDFKEKGNYEVKVTLQEVDMQGKTIEKNVENIPNINIGYSVVINEKTIASGGKLVDFDATSLSELGKIEWYFMDNLEKPIWTGEKFIVGKPIFTETQVGMYIRRNDKTSEVLDKLFIISGDSETKLDGEIKYTRSLIDDLEYEFIVENAQNDIGNGIVEEYKWTIGDKEITKQGDVTNPTESSKIIFKFDSYGEKDIKVVIKNTAGQTREITAKVDIPKILRLSSPLIIQDEGVAVSNLKYEPKLNEYYINEIGVPTKLTLDARFIKTNNILYTLKKVSFDYNSDGDMDEVTKVGTYNADIEGNHTITVYYEFVNRRIADDVIKMKEVIYIEGIKKEAIITFDINKNSTYVPITVAFDASKSQVKNENIEKFIWDYGDGVSEERDAIVPGHKYTTPGDYIVKLKVITTSGKQYSTSRSLVLKPKPQSVKISSSMINAPVGQGIDFTSEESEGQIIGYFWDFGDGSTSVQANPTHAFKKAGTYTVTLKLDYANKNILEDKIEIKVTED
ncbi:MAG: PKD domain-containing protein, partial [Candidatus Gracilibacteria bacterium]|nr:PKD domain-containing protein [Candidatus Gracilibacteria bacterium]